MPTEKAVRYDQLYAPLIDRLPCACDAETMKRALRTSAIRFCTDSKAWRQVLTPITTVANQLSYTVENKWAADIIKIERVGIRTAAEITADADDEGSEIHYSHYEFVPSSQTLKFSSAPATDAVTDALHVTAILVPQFKSNEIASSLLNLYHEGIIAGAVADICNRPVAPYFNEREARRAGRDFNNAVARAISDVAKKYGNNLHQIQGGYSLL